MASLTMRKGSGTWYGTYRYQGKRKVINLGVKIRGIAPAKVSEKGDSTFEQSRGEAQQALKEYIKELEERSNTERLKQEIIQSRTGEKLKSIPLNELIDEFLNAPRKRQLSEKVQNRYRYTLGQFVEWVNNNYADKTEVSDITTDVAKAYMQHLESQVAAPTYNARLTVLRAAFDKILRKVGLTYNPFDKNEIPHKEENVVSRRPYTVEQLTDILNAAENYPQIKPLIIVALSTAMRLGDCAQLEWRDVDLENGFITVKTSKTGETVDIPLFPKLKQVLLDRRGNNSDYVFPEVAEKYQHNRHGLTQQLRRVLVDAGFEDDRRSNGTRPQVKPLTQKEIEQAVTDIRTALPEKKRTDRVVEVFSVYADGADINEVVNQTGVSKATISAYLNECEDILGRPVVRGKVRKSPAKYGSVKQHRDGAQSASVYDWHSFRTTFVSLALTSGIPLEVVKRITGHQTADIVLKHYLRPERQQIRDALEKNMPDMLTDGGLPESREEKIIQLLEGMTHDNMAENRDAALALLRNEKEIN